MTSLLIAALLASTPDAGTPETLPELRRLAKQLEPQLTSPWVKSWLANVSTLTPVKPSTWFCTKDRQSCVAKKPSDAAYEERRVDDEYVYARITDPLGYARAFEVLAAAGFDPTGKKVVDFGYGNVGQLLMLARLGADVHGVEIDSLIPLVTRHLVGKVGAKGRLTLHHGFFASDAKLVKDLGTGFDLWLSKNTLKRGYVHPTAPKGAKAQIDLGLDDAKVLALIFSELKPGGFFFIYNLAPAQGEPYKPMADGHCPFAKEALVDAGFEVLAYDADDTAKARDMARALEWGDDPIFATYTLVRRPK
jgi:hypothetical protein